MILRPPRSTRTDTLFPRTTLFRSGRFVSAPSTISVRHLLQSGRRLSSSETVSAKADLEMTGPIAQSFSEAGPGEEPGTAPCGAAARRRVRNPSAAGDVHHARSEERRVGKECVSTGRSRGSPYPKNKKTND